MRIGINTITILCCVSVSAYQLEAAWLHQQLDLKGEEPFPEAYYSGTNVSVIAYGFPVYSVGSLEVREVQGLSSLVIFRSTVSNIVTSGIDIDEIGGLNLTRVGGAFFSKSESSRYLTTGTLVGTRMVLKCFV